MSEQGDEDTSTSVEENGQTNHLTSQLNGLKLTKNQKRKLRNKKKKQERKVIKSEREINNELRDLNTDQETDQENDENIEIEYVPEKIEIEDCNLSSYFKVFERFSSDSNSILNDQSQNDQTDEELKKRMLERKKPQEFELKEDDENENGEPKISKRKLKQMTRMTISELKQKVYHPELVEMHDVTAKDPLTLLNLKSTRNTVPVPRHWCYKRKYLQGKF